MVKISKFNLLIGLIIINPICAVTNWRVTRNLLTKNLDVSNAQIVRKDLTVLRNLVTKNLDVRNGAKIKNLKVTTNLVTKNLQVTNAALINGLKVNTNLTVLGSITSNNVATNYLNAQTTSTQAVTTTFSNILSFGAVIANQWTISGASSQTFNVPTTGKYLIEYNVTVSAPIAVAQATIMTRFLLNSATTLPGSVAAAATIISVQSTQSLNKSFLATLTAGDVLNLQIVASSSISGLQLSSSTLSGVTSPSASITITKIT